MLSFLRTGTAKQKKSEAPDADLIAACLSGNATAWDTLIERYEALVYTVGVRMGLSKADAEDVFQDVCLLLFNHLGDLRDQRRLSSWLISTTKREVWRLHRRRGDTPSSAIPEWQLESGEGVATEAAPMPEESLLALEDQHLVRQALTHLGDKCRQLLTALYCNDPPASYAEASQKLGMPVGSVGPQRARCLQQMGKVLQDLGF